MPTHATWRSVPALATPVEVAAIGAPRPVTGHPVQAAAFVSATTGWVVLHSSSPPMSWLLRTEDAGATWTSQLAWPGNLLGRLRAFDAYRASLALGLWPTYSNEINGQPVAAHEPYFSVLAGTWDAGATWTLGSPSDRQAKHVHFLDPRRIWLLAGMPGSESLARTEDGGATWSQIEYTGDLPPIEVGFSSPADGLLIAADGRRADILYRTIDAGGTWARQRLPPPPGLPASAETWLFPVLGPEMGDLLTLRAVSRRPSDSRPKWEGTYGYARSGDDWIGPHRLPMPPASVGHDLLAPGPGGRLWGASGHDVWVGDDLAGPWQHRHVPLSDEETIADLCPVADGVVWLTTANGVAGGGLYRSDDDGLYWTRVSPVDQASRPNLAR